jgi:hypothetical protein
MSQILQPLTLVLSTISILHNALAIPTPINDLPNVERTLEVCFFEVGLFL